MFKQSLLVIALLIQTAEFIVCTRASETASSSGNASATATVENVVLDWTPSVGEPGRPSTPSEQALNEALPRHVYLKRLKGDSEPHEIAWSVRAQEGDDYPAQPALFGGQTFPSGVALMPSKSAKVDIAIHLYPEGRRDWPRSFEVAFTDAVTGRPVVSPDGKAIIVGFAVSGDLKCKVGRADRCANTERLAAGTLTSPDRKADRLLATFCDPSDMRGTECLHVRRYPLGPQCNVELTGRVYSGDFLTAGRNTVIADYRSGCEPHASNFGGVAIFEEVYGRVRFQGFVPGVIASDCVVVPSHQGLERLVCISSYNGQGEEITSLTELRLTQTSAKRYSITADHFSEAQDNKGVYGLTRVSCLIKQDDLGIANLSASSQPDAVSVSITYLDERAIRDACASPNVDLQGSGIIADAGSAYIKEGVERRRVVTFDLADRSAIVRSDAAVFAK
jgi:hypothetical protein